MSGFLQVAAASFAALFLAAVVGKLDSWRAWKELVNAISPRRLPNVLISLSVPVVEAGVAVMLVVAPRAGLVAAALLLGVLAAGVLVVSIRHTGRPCACFGAMMPSEIKRSLAARNAVLAALAGAAAYRAQRLDVAGLSVGKVMIVALGLAVLSLALERRRLNRFVRGGLARD